MRTDWTSYIVNGVVTITGIVLTGLFTYYSARSVSDKQARNTALAKLRSVFAPARVECDRLENYEGCPYEFGKGLNFIQNELVRQSVAIEVFKPFVGKNKKYQQAWQDYKEELKLRFSGMPTNAIEKNPNRVKYAMIVYSVYRSIYKNDKERLGYPPLEEQIKHVQEIVLPKITERIDHLLTIASYR